MQGKLQPDPLDAFYIYEPKKRLIQAPTFRDKVVQHALTDYIVYAELSRSFTLNTYAAQYGKGTHYGLEMLEKHMRRHFLQKKGADEAERRTAGLPPRPMEEWDYAKGAVINGDIRHFFQSIDHDRLKAALAARFPDPRLQTLMWRYIDAVDGGLALGHQTSHIYAVFFVHSIMHFVGEKLHLPLAGMYMDDWYVICSDMGAAREALKLIRAQFAALGLELNRRIRLWEKQYAAGEITREKIEECYGSWEAHAKHGDTRALRKQMRSRLNAALERAENRRRAAGLPPPSPGPIERRINRYGTVTFQSGNRQSRQAERERPGQEVYRAG